MTDTAKYTVSIGPECTKCMICDAADMLPGFVRSGGKMVLSDRTMAAMEQGLSMAIVLCPAGCINFE